MKENCWNFKNCGYEPGGLNVGELGVCSAATEQRLNGIHGGINGGRSCWAVAGTLCDGNAQGGYSQKISYCRACDFFREVNEQEGQDALKTITILSMLG